jgi:hypothetical protein
MPDEMEPLADGTWIRRQQPVLRHECRVPRDRNNSGMPAPAAGSVGDVWRCNECRQYWRLELLQLTPNEMTFVWPYNRDWNQISRRKGRRIERRTAKRDLGPYPSGGSID